jgi:hypothetical protein
VKAAKKSVQLVLIYVSGRRIDGVLWPMCSVRTSVHRTPSASQKSVFAEIREGTGPDSKVWHNAKRMRSASAWRTIAAAQRARWAKGHSGEEFRLISRWDAIRYYVAVYPGSRWTLISKNV